MFARLGCSLKERAVGSEVGHVVANGFEIHVRRELSRIDSTSLNA
jgi:hypothetical protein